MASTAIDEEVGLLSDEETNALSTLEEQAVIHQRITGCILLMILIGVPMSILILYLTGVLISTKETR